MQKLNINEIALNSNEDTKSIWFIHKDFFNPKKLAKFNFTINAKSFNSDNILKEINDNFEMLWYKIHWNIEDFNNMINYIKREIYFLKF